ncbi:hypothetical protein P8452_38375 [Trifolium repens]|nr:hypothetical protein P8452_38375 [Trifolium repens]
MCSKDLVEAVDDLGVIHMARHNEHGLHCLALITTIFWNRKNELHQVAQQASNIEDLTEVVRASLSVMSRQWSDAMHAFKEKFNFLSTLITDHDRPDNSNTLTVAVFCVIPENPQEEFLSLLGGARTSPAVRQFLNTLGEAGVKRISKVLCGAGKELQRTVLEHLQPTAEVIGIRMGELRGLSRWRAGSFICLAAVFKLLQLAIKVELVIIFLRCLYEQDPVKQLIEISETDYDVEIDLETAERVSDTEYLRRTLAKEFQQLELSFKEAFQMPFTTISRKILCEDLLPLFPLPSLPQASSSSSSSLTRIPTSISYYEDPSRASSLHYSGQHQVIDYISLQVPDESFSDIENCICIVRGFMHNSDCLKKLYCYVLLLIINVLICQCIRIVKLSCY